MAVLDGVLNDDTKVLGVGRECQSIQAAQLFVKQCTIYWEVLDGFET